VLVVRFVGSLAAVYRLRRRVLPVNAPDWTRGLERCRPRLGIKRPVALAVSGQVTVPIVIGWFRPMVILPGTLADRSDRAVVEGVLLHELAHVRRGDYAWNLLLRLTQALYWFHPLIWAAGRLVTVERERACDDFCIHGLGDRERYRATLLELAGAITRRPGPSLGMAMAASGATRLGRRLDWIDTSAGSSRCQPALALRVALAALGLVVGAGLGALEPARAETSEPLLQDAGAPATKAVAPKPDPTVCEVTVVDRETNRPLEGATIRSAIDMRTIEVRTDANGRAKVVLAGRVFGKGTLNLDVWDEAHVQQRHFFSNFNPKEPPLPDRVTIALIPGNTTYGGTVKDEERRPIAGVKVRLWGHLDEKQDPKELLYMIQVRTDADGRWQARGMRRMKFVNLYLEHPDYLSDGVQTARAYKPPTAALRHGTDVQVMTRGIPLSGRVRDDQGRPIAGATVLSTPNPGLVFQEELPATLTDAEGRFRFPHAKPGKVALIVRARGHAPGLVEVEADASLAPVESQLGPARSLTGRVVDSQGKPLRGGFVNVDTWRTYRCLGVFLATDADGRFRWDDAPPDEVLLNVDMQGHLGVHRQPVTPAAREVVFTLHPSLKVRGRVRDATTGKPVESANVDRGVFDPKLVEYVWGKTPTAFAFSGYLQADFDASASPSYRLRVTAGGYRPALSPEFKSGDGEVTWDVALEPADSSAGKVVGPEGRPVAGATVFVLNRRSSLSIQDGRGNPHGETLRSRGPTACAPHPSMWAGCPVSSSSVPTAG
jgi:protocatechuate 3,4-dioxygenase beta subunit